MKFTHLLSMASIILLMGCTAITPVEKQYSGFLGDYSDMEKAETPDGSDVMRWVSPSVQKGKYKKVIVPAVTFFPAPRTSDQVKLETLHKISLYMSEQLKKELSKNFEVTDVPGPDTLHVQIAITGVATPMKGLKVYEAVPLVLVYAGATAAMGARDNVVVVYAEGLMTDSVTGQTVAKGVRQGVGESLRNDKQELDVEKVKTLLNGWAAEVGMLAKRLL